MISKIYNSLKNIHNKSIFFLIYLFLFSPIFITYAINQDTIFKKPEQFLFIFVTIVTILSFLAIILVYYYNFFIYKRIHENKFAQTSHLKKIFISYIYIIFIFANLFYMTQYMQNISTTKNIENTSYFNFEHANKNNYVNNFNLYVDCVYLSITTITTIGYGEVISNYSYGKFLIAVEAMIGQIIWGLSMTLWFVKKDTSSE